MSQIIRELAGEQRRRLVASILGYAEDQFRDVLTNEEWQDFREKVLTSVGIYHDFLLDVLKVNHDDMVQNEHAIALIRSVYESQQRLERSLGD